MTGESFFWRSTVRLLVAFCDPKDDDETAFSIYIVQHAVPPNAETVIRHRVMGEVTVCRWEWIVGELGECASDVLSIHSREPREITTDRRMVHERPTRHTRGSGRKHFSVGERSSATDIATAASDLLPELPVLAIAVVKHEVPEVIPCRAREIGEHEYPIPSWEPYPRDAGARHPSTRTSGSQARPDR